MLVSGVIFNRLTNTSRICAYTGLRAHQPHLGVDVISKHFIDGKNDIDRVTPYYAMTRWRSAMRLQGTFEDEA
jgi:hypothetical protein